MTGTVLTGLITWADGQPQNRVMKEELRRQAEADESLS